jgi:hypothetical protein
MTATPFFSTLGALASHQQENQLSRTFKACFDSSESFRHLLLDFLRERLDVPLPRSDRWTCDVEQAVKGKMGRLDLHIRARDGDDVFAIESKVESPLREEQIAKYRKGGVKRLLIVTKHPPEVSERRLRQLGVSAFRWQDIHNLLRSRQPRSPVDRFLCGSFADFLEEAGMAYPRDITTQDLRHMGVSFRAIASPCPAGRNPRSGFGTASSCLDLLGVLAQSVRDQYRRLESAKQWGPAYYNYDDGKRGLHHYLSVVFYRKPFDRGPRFYLQIGIPNNPGDLIWSVEYYRKDSEEPDFSVWKKLKTIGIRHGALDTDVLLASVLDCANSWKVRL